MPRGDFQAVRMMVFTAPFSEDEEIPRRYKVYERKLQFNPGIASDLYDKIVSVLPPGISAVPDDDSMEIIPSANWHPDTFKPDAGEIEIRDAVVIYLQENESGAAIQAGCLMHVESENCLVFCALM